MATTIALPTSVKVGPLVYVIVPFDPVDAAARNLYGEAVHRELKLRIDVTHGEPRAALTVLHELIHAVITVFRIDHKTASEEQLVEQLEAALGSVMADSPEIFEFMLAGLRR